MRFIACLGLALLWPLLVLFVVNTSATPFPSPAAQMDLDGNCAVNFPGDTILHAKIALGIIPMPTGFGTCREWYYTVTPLPTPSETPVP